MVVVTLLKWFIVKAARILATASATLVSVADALGVSTGSPRPSSRQERKRSKATVGHNKAVSTTDLAFVQARDAFLGKFGSAYGYGDRVEELSATEFSRLRGRVYVDHAGATLYSEQQLAAVHRVKHCLESFIDLLHSFI
jgi:molybdenum cofactor sulfurtransferase